MRSILTTKNSAARKLVSILGIGTMAANLALASMVVLPMTEASLALPKTCVMRTYYDGADMQNEVGMRSSCPGAKKWGKVTKFVEAETIDLVPEGPGGPGGGGDLPCEFLASGCSPIPGPRH
jgi:hypothetical protein